MRYEIPNKVEVFGKDIQKDELKYHNRRVIVSKEFTFDSAHHLHLYEGKCKSLHGHTYRLVVEVSGRLDEIGFVIDFSDIKRIVKETVIAPLDHRYLNEVLPKMNTTAENMIVWIYDQIADALRQEVPSRDLRVEEVKLWETPTSYARVTYDMMEEPRNE